MILMLITILEILTNCKNERLDLHYGGLNK